MRAIGQYKRKNAVAPRLRETPAEKRASDIQDRIFYVLLALAVIEGAIFVLGDGVAWEVMRVVWGSG